MELDLIDRDEGASLRASDGGEVEQTCEQAISGAVWEQTCGGI
jgi:hypothetical protein